ncbi:MAG: alpha/beta hydrolase, partial [Nitrospina sp.]|nr:alpha/beta hydrolase [Nitrospina sp.]
KQHKVDSLNGSLNAADVADKVSAISQIHYVGERDKVIGRYVTESFIFKAGSENCIQLKMVSGATHTKGWETLWPKLIREKLPICGEK